MNNFLISGSTSINPPIKGFAQIPGTTKKFALLVLSPLLLSSTPANHISARTQLNSETTKKLSIKSSAGAQILNLQRADLKIIKKLRNFSLYQNEEGHSLVSDNAIEDAEKFIRNIDFNSIKQPYLSAIEDGEINFWWNYPELRIDLGMYGDGTYSYYARFADGAELMEDSVLVSKPLSKEILNVLKI